MVNITKSDSYFITQLHMRTCEFIMRKTVSNLGIRCKFLSIVQQVIMHIIVHQVSTHGLDIAHMFSLLIIHNIVLCFAIQVQITQIGSIC